jgi:hypothetical protein
MQRVVDKRCLWRATPRLLKYVRLKSQKMTSISKNLQSKPKLYNCSVVGAHD